MFSYKRLFVLGSLAYVLYLTGGILLASTGVIRKVYFLPGWSIKAPSRDVGFAAEGPVVRYHGALALSTAIVPHQGKLAIRIDSLPQPAGAQLPCYSEELRTSFTVTLQPHHTVPASEYPAPDRLLVVSDLEGNFKGLNLLLRRAGVIDSALHWQFGTGHLVVVGDVFDRGQHVTECLWLLYQLEQEAARAGGQMHLILGNHELMNLTGQYQYVRGKYRRNADYMGLPYSSWYGRDTELGRWLRSRNVAEKIGSTLFVHGGISPEVAAYHLDLPQLNARSRALIDVADKNALRGLDSLLARSELSPDWYRGLAREQAPAAHVHRVLAEYGVRRLVIGHTPFAEITPLYQGQVIGIDLPHQQNVDEHGLMKALWIEGDHLYTIGTDSPQLRPLL